MLLPVTMLGSLAACGSDSTVASVPVQCPPTVSKTVDSANPIILVSYQEPTHKLNGERLDSLSHTTVYYDTGGGTVEHRKHSATNVSGGGTVESSVTIPVKDGETATANICVTATSSGGESPPTL
jgi:hypothetical protein